MTQDLRLITSKFINRADERKFYLTGVASNLKLFGDVMVANKDLPETERREKARLACVWRGYEILKGVEIFDN